MNPKVIRGISVSACSRFNCLDSLSRFSNLNELVIRGGMSSVSTFNDFNSIAELHELEYVVIAGRLKSKSLLPLAKLKKLKYLGVSTRIKVKDDQYQEILEACPKLARIDFGVGHFSREDGMVRYEPSKDL